MRRPSSSINRTTLREILVVLAVIAAATLGRWLIDPALGVRLPYITYFAAIFYIAWRCPLWLSIVALFAAWWAADFFFIDPRYLWWPHGEGAPHYVGTAMYFMVGGTSIAICQAMRAAQYRAAEQAERLGTTLASIGDAVIATDTDGRVTSMNAVAESLTGWTADEAMGQPLDSVFRIFNEQTRQPVASPAKKALETGVSVGLANHTVLISKDGTQRPIDDSAAPIRCKEGEVVGCVLVFRDVTERRRTEIAGDEQKRLLALRVAIGNALSAEPNLQSALQWCAQALVEHLDAAFARIWTLDEQCGELVLQASAGIYTHLDGPHCRIKMGEYKIGRIAQNRRPHLTNDVLNDPNISDPQWAEREGMVAFAGYPLLVENRVMGVVAVFARRELSESVLTEFAPLSDGIAQYLDRKQVEERLRDSEERWRLALDSAELGAWNIDPATNSLETDARFRAIFGVSNEQVSYEQAFAIIHADDRERIREAVAAATRPDDPASYVAEYRVVHPDGSIHWVYAKGRANFEPSATGRHLVSFDGTVVDITDRKHAEEALLENERRLRFIMDSAPQKIFTARPNGEVDYFNPQWTEFTGLSFEQIRDWGWTQFIHPDDLEENIRAWQHSIDTGEPFRFEHRFRRADGEFRWHLSRALPLRDETGRITMWTGSNTDIHEQKNTAIELRQLAAELSEADRRKNEFLATLAHELRNPLAPIRNALEIIQQTEGDNVVRSASEMMERQIAQLVRLVDDLLDVSRISRGKIELRKDRLELSKAVNDAVDAVRPLCQRMNHRLTVHLPSEPLIVHADSTRLAQVIGNLLNNACKFTDDGGQIWLSVEPDGDWAVVRVRDDGIGIAADQLSRIFDMFAQVDTSLERPESGLGIGLTLVKNLVQMHDGSVEAYSDGAGKGSEFVVRLPTTDELPSSTHEPSDGEQTAAIARRILVVDDNRDSAQSLAMLLKLAGHETQTAHDGMEALEAAASFRPDAILLDIGLPRLNGYETARRIRIEPWGQNILLVALTGWGQVEDRRKSHEAGFDEHFVKPVDLQALAALLADSHSAPA